MKPSAYASYKPSGVEWLGDIPSHWQPKRLRFLLTQKLQYGANEAAELDDPELPRYVRITDIDEQGTLREETFRSLHVETAKPYLLKDGDILFARSGATSGKTFLYRNSWGTCAYAGYLIRARLNQEKMLPSFLRYFTSSANYWQWLSSSTIQATIQNVSAEKYADLWLTYPPIAEQQTIADFLDAQTAKIDTLLAKKRQFIAKLKEKRSALIARTVTRGLPPDAAQAAGLEPHPAMKDSGVEWLGSIPAHWEVKPLKHVANRSEVKVEADEDNPLPYIGLEHVESWTGCLLPLDEELVPTGISNYFKSGDTLFGKLRPYLAKACNVDFDGLCSSELLVLRGKDYAPQFLLYQLLSGGFINLVDSSTYGSKMPRAGWDFIGSCELPTPPLEEQQAIAAYLDRETARIDQLTTKVETAIARLTEYRQALITAAVTGKIDVRNNARIKEVA